MTSHARPLKAIAFATLVVGVLAVRPAEAFVIYWQGYYLVLRINVPYVGPIDPISDVIIHSPTQTLDEGFIPDPIITGTGDLGTWEYDYVTTDQDGDPLTPNGIRFLTDDIGLGISNGHYAEFQFRSLHHPDTASCQLSAVYDYRVNYFDSATGQWTSNVTPRCVPEPQIIGLMAAGLTVLAGLQRRRRRGTERADD